MKELFLPLFFAGVTTYVYNKIGMSIVIFWWSWTLFLIAYRQVNK